MKKIPFPPSFVLQLGFGLFAISQSVAQVDVEIVAGPNLIVDSNVLSPSTYAPDTFTVQVNYCNNTASPIDNVYAHIGNIDGGGTVATPGVYPVRDSDTDAAFQAESPHLANTGDYQFSHAAANADSTRYLGTLAPGECKVVYWMLCYPRVSNDGSVPVWGQTRLESDDLWLEMDAWASQIPNAGVIDPGNSVGEDSHVAIMKNSISAMANKIGGPTGSGWFTGSTPLTSNAAPFGTGDPVYIWGFNISGEWILMTNAAWAWPTAAGGDALPPATISVGTVGATAVVGTVSPDASAGYQMMSAVVSGEIPKTAPELWLNQYFDALERADPAISGWCEDPDEDGALNIEELAAGTDPQDPDSVQLADLTFEQIGDSAYCKVELPRKGRADIEHIFALSTDLVAWDETGTSVVTVEDSNSRLILRSSNAVAATAREFYRLILVKP